MSLHTSRSTHNFDTMWSLRTIWQYQEALSPLLKKKELGLNRAHLGSIAEVILLKRKELFNNESFVFFEKEVFYFKGKRFELPFSIKVYPHVQKDCVKIFLQIFDFSPIYSERQIGKGTYKKIENGFSCKLSLNREGMLSLEKQEETVVVELRSDKPRRSIPGILNHQAIQLLFSKQLSSLNLCEAPIHLISVEFNSKEYWFAEQKKYRGSLKQHQSQRREKFTLKEKILSVADVLETLHKLHLKGYAFGDFRKENLLIQKESFRTLINDFDFLTPITSKRKWMDAGYLFFDHSARKGMVLPQTDIYAVLITVLEMVIPCFLETKELKNCFEIKTEHLIQLLSVFANHTVVLPASLQESYSQIHKKIQSSKEEIEKIPFIFRPLFWRRFIPINQLLKEVDMVFHLLSLFERELKNSLLLYEKLQKMAIFSSEKTLTQEEYQTINKELNLTSAEKLYRELTAIVKLES